MARKRKTDISSSGDGAGEGSGSQNLGGGRRDGAQSSTASQIHGGTHHPAAPQQHGGAQYSQVPRLQGGAGRGWGPGNPQQLGRRGGVNTGDGAYATVGRGVGPSTPPVPELHQATQPPHQAASASLPEASSSSPDVALAEHVGKLSLQAEPAASQAMVPASIKSMRFPLRPSKGSCGTNCVVKANHFYVELRKKDLHQYDVSITPEVTSRGVNRAVMKELVRVFTESRLDGRLPAYDGRKSLYTAGPLPFTSNEFQVTLVDEDDGNGRERRPKNFRIVIKLAARVDLHHLGMFLSGKQAVAPQEALQVLAIVLREFPTARYSPVGRCFYSPNLCRRQPLGEGIESWRGFYQSIRPTQMGLSLIIDQEGVKRRKGCSYT